MFGPFRTQAAHGVATSAIGMVALMATLIGFLLAYIFYIRQPELPGRIAARASALYQLLVRKYYVDELYNLVFGRFLFWGSENVLSRGVDHGLIDGIVDGTGLGVEEAGDGHAALGNRQRPGLCVCVPAGRGGDRRLLRLPGDGALMGGSWLTAVVFTPLLGALFVLAQPEERATWRAGFIFSLIPLAISIYIFAAFDPAQADYQFVEQYSWIPQFGISYHLGIDGISLFLVLLTTVLFSLSMLYSGGGDIETRPREFCFFMLVLEMGLLGTLLAVDLFLFYVFWELMLIPMYFLIGIWGHGRKYYAAFKFILYTMLGSILMLVAILYLVSAARAHLGHLTFDLPALYERAAEPREATWLFAAFALAFAIKVPMWPLHTWLPDAHTEAPTAGSVILAGVMLKMGTYGFLRFAIPLFPGGRDRRRAAVPGAGGGRNHLRRAGRDGAAGPQAARCLLLGQPSGFRDARHLRAQPAGDGGRDLPDAEPRHFHRRAVLADRDDLSAPPHARDRRVRRPVAERSDLTPPSSW